MKNKKTTLVVAFGSVACIAIACVVVGAMANSPKPEVTESSVTDNSSGAVITEISTLAENDGRPLIVTTTNADTTSPEKQPDIPEDTSSDIDSFDESEYIEIDQSFDLPLKTEETPPPAPVIEDDEVLTNPEEPPVYETTVYEQTPPAPEPSHGEEKDGYIYIKGFGWVEDEGGGGECEDADDMYENGNKVGYFG